MALKKSDLYSSLWKSCDELRGGMDASQYKDYILTLLFVKYVSDKAKADPNSLIDVPKGGSFDDMLAAKGDKEIGDRFNKIIAVLAEANGLQKVIDVADFDDEEKLGKGKEMQDRLSKLVAIFADLDFRGSQAEGDDLLGDAYEYLMRNFATESGKSKGQFYTPAEVSRILAKVVGIGPRTKQDQTAYDPACGSGSLLLKAAAEAPRGITIYGQEKDNATWALSKMNMILHGNEVADLRKGDTLTSPQFTRNDQLQTFDFIVMNPPFSVKSWNNGLENDYGRFEFGRPPDKNGDYAFLLHVIKSLKSKGKAAVILPHGVLFRPGAEAKIRQELLKRGYIKGIIGLPPNLFYGTGIKACVVVIDKEDAAERRGVFMLDASRGFKQDGNKNRLRSQDIHKIVDTFNRQIEIGRYSRMVPLKEIGDPSNNFNLNISRYVDSAEPADIQDLQGHLEGGIPEADVDDLSEYWAAFPNLRSTLLSHNRPGYLELAENVDELQDLIINSGEFKKLSEQVVGLIRQWFDHWRADFEKIDANTRPSALIVKISNDLLSRFQEVPLIDEYDVYEQLMSYWDETQHDDVFAIMNLGWLKAMEPRKTIMDSGRKLDESPDLTVGVGRNIQKYKMDLIPPALIVAKYFADLQTKIDGLNRSETEASRMVAEFIDEHAVEEGLLAEAMDDDKINKTCVAARLAVAKRDGNDPDEIKALEGLMALYEAEATAKKASKEAKAELAGLTLNKYGTLKLSDVKTILLDEKWFGDLASRVTKVVEAQVLRLVERLSQLGRRYAETLGEIDDRMEAVNGRVVDRLNLLTGKTRLPGFRKPWRVATLSALLSYEQPGRYLVSTTRQLESGRVPVLTAGKTFVLGYTNDTDGVCKTHPVIIFDDFTTASKYVDFDFKAKSSAMKILRSRPGVADLRFIYERMQLISFFVGDHKRHWISEYSKIEILVPELEEQVAVAKALQEFDELAEATHDRAAKLSDLKMAAAQRLIPELEGSAEVAK